MKLELTTGVATSAGLLILFGAGYGAIDTVIESGATRQLEETVAAQSQAVALGGVLRWERLMDRYRGIVRAGVQNPTLASAEWSESEQKAQAAENVLATLLGRTNGRGQAAVLDADGKVVSSTVAIAGTKSHEFTTFRAVKDAMNGSSIVRAELEGSKMHVVATRPISSAGAQVGVLVVTSPVDNRQIKAWSLEPPVMVENSVLLLANRTGDRFANNFTGAEAKGSSRIVQPGLVNVADTEYWASREALIDDGGLVGHVVGLSIVSREHVNDLVQKVRRMVLLLGAVALLMTLMVSMFTPASPPVQVAAPAAQPITSHTSPSFASPLPPPVTAGASPPVGSVSDDLPPLRLGHNDDSAGGEEQTSSPPQLGLAAQLAAAASQDTASSPPVPARSEAASQAVSEIPTPENAGDVTRGKGASPRPEAIEAMMGPPPVRTPRPKSSQSLPPPPPVAEPISAADPVPPPSTPVSAEPGPFAVGSIDDPADSPSSEDVPEEVSPTLGATDLPPPAASNWSVEGDEPAFGTAPFSASLDGNMGGGGDDLGFTPGFGEGDNGFSIPGSEPPPAFLGEEESPPEDPANLLSGPPMGFDSIPPPPPVAMESTDSASSDGASGDPMSFTAAFASPKPDESEEEEEPSSAGLLFGEAPGALATDPAESSEAAAPDLPPVASAVGSLPLPSANAVSDGAATLMTHGAPPPPPPLPASDTESTASMEGVADNPSDEAGAYSEAHYRSVFEKFVGSKRDLGENVDGILFEGFSEKLRKSEAKLIEQHGCKAVRFEVLVKGEKVSLRPQLVR